VWNLITEKIWKYGLLELVHGRLINTLWTSYKFQAKIFNKKKIDNDMKKFGQTQWIWWISVKIKICFTFYQY
jgi:hypothetical protein